MDTSNSSEDLGEDLLQQSFHVLAVDDSHVDRKILERLLSLNSSYHVTCVDSGDKALEYLGLLEGSSFSPSSSNSSHEQEKALKVNLIMTDYSMPGITGYDLLTRLKGSSWKDIPVVVMSSENVPSRINMCLEGGAEEFLLKPLKVSDLRKIHSHLLNTVITNSENEDSYVSKGENADEEIVVVMSVKEEKDNKNYCNSSSNKRKVSLTASSASAMLFVDRVPLVQELHVS